MGTVNGATIKDAPIRGEPDILVLEDFGEFTSVYFPLYRMPEGCDLRSASNARQIFWFQMFTVQAERVTWE